MKTSVFIATSLDGFIAREDGNLDWLNTVENPSGDDFGYSDFIAGIDAIVMGRVTFEKVLTFPTWPYDRKVFVLSTTLMAVPENLSDRSSVLSMSPSAILHYLEGLGYSHIYLDGGKTIQNFLEEDLVDELTITRIPILLGRGIPLFGELSHDILFDHIQTMTYAHGLVQNRYKRK